ncbi:Hypothetical protein CINCED_3A009555 [Cinara cedri]|uniref:Uncharacterized protein n=1 Tax=Cinara cedri TaxID=506608 RepID=A0A5E4MHV3_9HEMI|nr:Hypothetical protein CINCED_3A009555 [Cinara cedri]
MGVGYRRLNVDALTSHLATVPCRSVGSNPWGLPYKVVTKRIGRRRPGIEVHGMESVIADHLFPNLPVTDWALKPRPSATAENKIVVDFTLAELAQACKRLPPGKGSGPDVLYRHFLHFQNLTHQKLSRRKYANYGIAIKKLQARYDNRDLVVQSHIREILNSPKIMTPSAQGLLELHSHVSSLHVAHPAYDVVISLYAVSMSSTRCCTGLRLSQPFQETNMKSNSTNSSITSLYNENSPYKDYITRNVGYTLKQLDKSSQEWQLRRTGTELTKYTELMEFVSRHSIALEGAEALASREDQVKDVNAGKEAIGKKFSLRAPSKGALVVASEVIENCACCSNKHKLYSCTKFKDLSVGDRIALVRRARLCFNCLHALHRSDQCKSKFNCYVCKGRHNTLLHYERQDESSVSKDKSGEDAAETAKKRSSRISLLVHHRHGHVFLSTALVWVKDKRGVPRKCHAILDSGS